MKKLLFIGHYFHNKTKSSQFILDILASKYEITSFYYNPYTDDDNVFSNIKKSDFDVVVLWQIMPSIVTLKKYVTYKCIAFFPMYDSVEKIDSPIWTEYKECNIINFCLAQHKKCKKYGLSSYYIKYFPKPQEITDWGDEKSVFLWQRTNLINPEIVKKTLGGLSNFNTLYLHKVLDPNETSKELSHEWKNKVKISTWFDTKEEMNNYMQACALYYAPRKLEGIGMSFLDAMAFGRCVIAPNNPTMNEYIQNGINGYLYSLKQPKKIKIKNIRKIQKNTIKYISDGYEKFQTDKFKILDWLEAPVEKNINKKLMDDNLSIDYKKKKITLYTIKVTKNYKIYSFFNFIKIKIRKKSNG